MGKTAPFRVNLIDLYVFVKLKCELSYSMMHGVVIV